MEITRDLASNVSFTGQSFVPAARTATANGTGVDLRDYKAEALVIRFGAITGTTPTMTIRWEESDDDSTYTAVAAADLDGGLVPAGLDATAANTVIKRGYLGTKRYVRAAITAIAGTSPVYNVQASVERSGANVNPVSLIGG